MNIKAFKYLSPVTVYILAWLAFTNKGLLTWSPLVYAFLLLPLAELFIKPDPKNFDAAEEELAKKDKMYDYMLYFFVVLQFVVLWVFLRSMQQDVLNWWEIIGRVWTMGLLCGTFGINIGHELGHRVNKFEQALAKASLLSSLYMHFFIEHNKGHHKNVATPLDPSSARYNEPIYAFYFRTIIFSYLSAWKIANEEMRKKGLPVLHWRNEMFSAHIIQAAFVISILILFGPIVTLYYLCAAGIGIGLLETVNYIEHYGLQRKQITDNKYERAMPWHSWNSDHILGRLMLFELSRHSDHHYLASKKYQTLRHHDDAPQLPTGYPGSMMLACIPPVWFYVMNKKIKELEKTH
ncbi:alkane 1-monooxygenase [Ferruginibacter lapsinanis]|uniref:alkane 1-monooxygenase n=1 Tax=Ferruginibacter lapsinanis TaxID=563172 RepID=UPI001E320C4C|nr:alkane 1-monooxygenase [Ferruginibacter lapsinanis]UEG50487.1 alkane 1-monooxygenase [Ferruginibacter lapsinanis]